MNRLNSKSVKPEQERQWGKEKKKELIMNMPEKGDVSGVFFNGEKPAERQLFWRYRNQRTVRKGDWKYLKIEDKEYLFNLKNDVEEQINLLDQHSEITSELKELLAHWEKKMDKYYQKTN